MQPLISIGMPVLNCGKTIHAAVSSIVNQSYTHWELLIFDDGSSDNTASVVKSFADSRIKLISDGVNRGLPFRLNQAVASSRGKYFARMDGDDISYPERFEVQSKFLESSPHVDLVGSRVMVFDDHGNVVGGYPFRQTHSEICRRPWAGFYLPHPTWMGRTSWFKANPYRLDATRNEDQDLLLRTHEDSCFACVPDILIGYRQNRLSLKNILTGRIHFSFSILHTAVQHRKYIFMLGILEQLVKSAVDTFAVISGLNYRILKHRAVAMEDQDVTYWKDVWDSVTKSGYKI